jgi:cytochrome c oxidase assembly protein subunit 11
MQDKFLKTLIYILLGSALTIFLLIQPFNIYCKITKKCYPITLSSFKILKKGEREIKINFSAKIPDNLKQTLDFYPSQKTVTKFSNEHINNSYFVKNLSNKTLTIKTHYKATPSEANQYLNRIECLCFQSQTLKPNEEVLMPIKFQIKKSIDTTIDIESIDIDYQIMVTE